MSPKKRLDRALAAAMLVLPLLVAGCTEDQRAAGQPGAKATGATGIGGAETSASPGGPNVRPDMATPPTGR
jgi:hypothetical protein